MRQGNDMAASSDVGTKGSGTRANALWGKGRRRYSLLLAIAVLAASVIAGAATTTVTAGAEDRLRARQALARQGEGQPERDVPGDHPDVRHRRRLDELDAAVGKAQKKHPGQGAGASRRSSS